MSRKIEINRKTSETSILMNLNLDGTGQIKLSTGLPFFEHMLSLWCCHGFFDLDIKASGDIDVEPHHLVEDIGICLGQAWNQLLGSKEGINRYGHSIIPMDDALVTVTVDLSGRPYLHYDLTLPPGPVGSMDPELFHEFWKSFVNEGRFNLHLVMHHGRNKHHIIEASFKAAGRAFKEAVSIIDGFDGILSTKGKLD